MTIPSKNVSIRKRRDNQKDDGIKIYWKEYDLLFACKKRHNDFTSSATTFCHSNGEDHNGVAG